MKMARRRAPAFLFMLFLLAACSQFATVLALPPSNDFPAKLPAARRIAPPASGDLAYSNYNIHVLVRALGMAITFYESIDSATNLPPNLRSLGPKLAAADKLRRERHEDEAIAAYRSITGGEIDTARLARSYLGQALVFAAIPIPEKRKKAAELLRLVVHYIPDNRDASLALALNYCFLQEWDNALQAARRAVRLQSNDAPAHYWLGWIYFHGLQDNANAIAHYQDAVRLKPDDEQATRELGIVCLFERLYANAIPYLKRAIRLKPDYGEAYWFLGVTYLEMNDRPQAQQVYRTLQRVDKDLAAQFARRM
jgi:tetratricopeptide (TPR) repeat protein